MHEHESTFRSIGHVLCLCPVTVSESWLWVSVLQGTSPFHPVLLVRSAHVWEKKRCESLSLQKHCWNLALMPREYKKRSTKKLLDQCCDYLDALSERSRTLSQFYEEFENSGIALGILKVNKYWTARLKFPLLQIQTGRGGGANSVENNVPHDSTRGPGSIQNSNTNSAKSTNFFFPPGAPGH